MPRWVKGLLLGMGLSFLAVGVIIGMFGTRQARAHVALLESLRPLTAATFPLSLAMLDAFPRSH